MTPVNRAIVMLQIDLNLSGQEMADKLGLNKSTYSRWRRGQVPLTVRDRLALAAVAAGLEPLSEPETKP